MEPEGSLPVPQKPSTGPYPEADQPRPYHPILSKIHFDINHPSILFTFGFPTNNLYAHLYGTSGKFTVLYILIFTFLSSKREDRMLLTEW
jgi:hypothetical protein